MKNKYFLKITASYEERALYKGAIMYHSVHQSYFRVTSYKGKNVQCESENRRGNLTISSIFYITFFRIEDQEGNIIIQHNELAETESFDDIIKYTIKHGDQVKLFEDESGTRQTILPAMEDKRQNVVENMPVDNTKQLLDEIDFLRKRQREIGKDIDALEKKVTAESSSKEILEDIRKDIEENFYSDAQVLEIISDEKKTLQFILKHTKKRREIANILRVGERTVFRKLNKHGLIE